MMWWCIASLLCCCFPIHFFLSQLVQTSNTSLNIIDCIANPHWPGWTAPLTKKDKTKQKKLYNYSHGSLLSVWVPQSVWGVSWICFVFLFLRFESSDWQSLTDFVLYSDFFSRLTHVSFTFCVFTLQSLCLSLMCDKILLLLNLYLYRYTYFFVSFLLFSPPPSSPVLMLKHVYTVL